MADIFERLTAIGKVLDREVNQALFSGQVQNCVPKEKITEILNNLDVELSEAVEQAEQNLQQLREGNDNCKMFLQKANETLQKIYSEIDIDDPISLKPSGEGGDMEPEKSVLCSSCSKHLMSSTRKNRKEEPVSTFPCMDLTNLLPSAQKVPSVTVEMYEHEGGDTVYSFTSDGYFATTPSKSFFRIPPVSPGTDNSKASVQLTPEVIQREQKVMLARKTPFSVARMPRQMDFNDFTFNFTSKLNITSKTATPSPPKFPPCLYKYRPKAVDRDVTQDVSRLKMPSHSTRKVEQTPKDDMTMHRF